MKLSVIIFSKDRACQLELLLRSIKIFFMGWEDVNINIIYKHTDEKFKLGYDLVKKIHPQFNYILEKKDKFMKQTLDCINNSEENIVFFVDDDVFKEKFSLKNENIQTFENNTKILCASLRLAPQINYSYTRNTHVNPPVCDENLIWDWQKIKHVSLWGYPMSVDGHIFRKSDILDVFKKIKFTNPNSLEHALSKNPINKKYMICFPKPIIMNIPWNKVQNENENHSENINQEDINKIFLSGKIISLDKIVKMKNHSTHENVELSFINN